MRPHSQPSGVAHIDLCRRHYRCRRTGEGLAFWQLVHYASSRYKKANGRRLAFVVPWREGGVAVPSPATRCRARCDGSPRKSGASGRSALLLEASPAPPSRVAQGQSYSIMKFGMGQPRSRDLQKAAVLPSHIPAERHSHIFRGQTSTFRDLPKLRMRWRGFTTSSTRRQQGEGLVNARPRRRERPCRSVSRA
jgi:hypothetical protein